MQVDSRSSSFSTANAASFFLMTAVIKAAKREVSDTRLAARLSAHFCAAQLGCDLRGNKKEVVSDTTALYHAARASWGRA